MYTIHFFLNPLPIKLPYFLLKRKGCVRCAVCIKNHYDFTIKTSTFHNLGLAFSILHHDDGLSMEWRLFSKMSFSSWSAKRNVIYLYKMHFCWKCVCNTCMYLKIVSQYYKKIHFFYDIVKVSDPDWALPENRVLEVVWRIRLMLSWTFIV